VALPGVTISRRDTPPARGADTDTGKWLVCGIADRGPEVPTEVISLDQFESVFGPRLASYSTLYDSLYEFFEEGGARALVSRVLGPAAAYATKNLLDSSAAVALVATAKSKGDWGNNLEIEVTHPTGTTFQLLITLSDVLVETSAEFATTTDAVEWSEFSDYITLTQGASTNDPAVAAAAALAGGEDDHANAVDAHWLAALNRFTKDYGPGQVSYPGRTTGTAHAQLIAHAEDKGRVAILDGADTATKATLTAAAAAARVVEGSRSAGLFAPWITVPGITQGTTRTVPPSSLAAGIMARNDGNGLSPNIAAAGDLGQSQNALGLSQAAWSDDDREDLNDAGVNVVRELYGGYRVYGARTLTDPTTDAAWLWLANARYYSDAVARGGAIAEEFLFSQLNGATISEFQGALMGEFLPDYTAGPLLAPPEVDVSGNTAETMADGQLLAVLSVVIAPTAERVSLEIVKER
jgi:phage tail sheath protein FI